MCYGDIVVKAYKAFAWGVHTGFDYYYYPTFKDLKGGTNLLFEADVVEMSNEDVYYTAGLDFRNVPKDKLYTYEYVFKINGDQLSLKSYRFYK